MGHQGSTSATDSADRFAADPAGTVSGRVRNWTFAAVSALGWALFTMVILHVVSSFDPVADPVSRYAFTHDGEGMLEASLVSMAVGVIAVRGALLASGVHVSRTATLLVAASSGGLLAAAAFPATFTSDIDPVSGLIHQYASVIAFLCLPGFAVCLIDQVRGIEALAVTRGLLINLAWACGIGLGLFALTYVGDKVSPDASAASVVLALLDALPVGLLQRIVFVLDFLLLTTLLVLANRAARAGR